VPTVNLAPTSLARGTAAGMGRPRRARLLARLRRARTAFRLAATDAAAVFGAAAALLPLLLRGRPVGRLPVNARSAAERPARRRLAP
jgi:hypothetical protein